MTARTSADKRRRILELRSEGDITQADAASRLGLHQSTVSRSEHAHGVGRRKRRSFSDAATGFNAPTEKK